MAKILLSLPDPLLKKLDKAAKSQHKKRSELFKELALNFLQQQEASMSQDDVFGRLREFKIKLAPGETAEGLIRQLRDSR